MAGVAVWLRLLGSMYQCQFDMSHHKLDELSAQRSSTCTMSNRGDGQFAACQQQLQPNYLCQALLVCKLLLDDTAA